jgi:heme iron utilization protein
MSSVGPSGHEHAEPGPRPERPAPPEPSFAERARTLVEQGGTGALATVSQRRAGHPFASMMPYAPDARGQAILLISALAVHTHNLGGDPRASLLVTAGGEGDALALGRVTLMGRAHRLDTERAAAARDAYLVRHPQAAGWADFGDFSFWRLDVHDVYLIGGFGSMGWVTAEAYAAAAPDPLARAAPGIIQHMNADHDEALVLLARVQAGVEAEEAIMTSVDRLGFTVRLRDGTRRWVERIGFPSPVATAEQCRAAFVEMLRVARAGNRRPPGS